MPDDKLHRIIIHSDGACRPNPGEGGWAAILRCGSVEKVLTGSEPITTSNRMELQAAISALESLKRRCRVDLFVDSTYVRKGICDWLPCRWSKNQYMSNDGPVKNIDLWQRLDQLTHKHDVRWHWLKGHSGDSDNERVHRLAHAAMSADQ